jgi:hypothetical protein
MRIVQKEPRFISCDDIAEMIWAIALYYGEQFVRKCHSLALLVRVQGVWQPLLIELFHTKIIVQDPQAAGFCDAEVPAENFARKIVCEGSSRPWVIA